MWLKVGLKPFYLKISTPRFVSMVTFFCCLILSDGQAGGGMLCVPRDNSKSRWVLAVCHQTTVHFCTRD